MEKELARLLTEEEVKSVVQNTMDQADNNIDEVVDVFTTVDLDYIISTATKKEYLLTKFLALEFNDGNAEVNEVMTDNLQFALYLKHGLEYKREWQAFCNGQKAKKENENPEA